MLWNIKVNAPEERQRSMEFRTVEAKRHAAVLVELKHVAREYVIGELCMSRTTVYKFEAKAFRVMVALILMWFCGYDSFTCTSLTFTEFLTPFVILRLSVGIRVTPFMIFTKFLVHVSIVILYINLLWPISSKK